MLSGLHHIELCVSNGINVLRNFTSQYGFFLRFTRETKSCKQWVVSLSPDTSFPSFVITERKDSIAERDDWSSYCCENSSHKIDSFFNVALQVRDVEKCTNRVLKNGGRVFIKPKIISDEHGSVKYSLVSSCVGNVMHTLIDRTGYPSSRFLPQFNSLTNCDYNNSQTENEKYLAEDIDHIAYVCERGQSKNIIDWYSTIFGMERFFVSNNESTKEGMVIENVGLRLKAMEYWFCAETGVRNNENTVKFVIAESLDGFEDCHVEAFLKEHGCPGIQHIGLSSSNICSTVKEMTANGVPFRHPPSQYYSLKDKISEIKLCGQNINELKSAGILLDAEDDDQRSGNKCRYLLQIFTYNIFKENTFFFEVIQRTGASGFGAGNIRALAESIEEDKHA